MPRCCSMAYGQAIVVQKEMRTNLHCDRCFCYERPAEQTRLSSMYWWESLRVSEGQNENSVYALTSGTLDQGKGYLASSLIRLCDCAFPQLVKPHKSTMNKDASVNKLPFLMNGKAYCQDRTKRPPSWKQTTTANYGSRNSHATLSNVKITAEAEGTWSLLRQAVAYNFGHNQTTHRNH